MESEYFGENINMCQIESCRKFLPKIRRIHLCTDCRRLLQYELLEMRADVKRDLMIKKRIDMKYNKYASVELD